MKLIVLLLIIFLAVLGIREKRINDLNVKRIPIRINVNGIRGKSTATRLITAILNESNHTTIGKTTGTAARIIYEDGLEKEIIRKPEGSNIKEQIKIIAVAKKHSAKALVCECMAVRPDYQLVYSRNIIKANIYVIVNVLEDHLDVMGPTTDQIAEAFGESIPYNGKLIIIKDQYTEYFKSIAEKRNTEVYIADNEEIPSGYLEKFEYVLFPDNVSIALAVAKSLNIDKTTALKGMLKANPDPGALNIKEIKNQDISFHLVNAFAANEPASTYSILMKLEELNYDINDMIIIFNGRDDRIDRTDQFIKDFFPMITMPYILVGMGQGINNIKKAYNKNKFKNIQEYIHMENCQPKYIVKSLMPYLDGKVVFAIGNIHGDGMSFIEEIEKLNGLESEKYIDVKIYHENQQKLIIH